MSHPLELLAPAGTIEVFEAAVRSGADAIYIGAPMANARALAKHFTYEEIAALVDFAHKKNVKVYVAMNSLIKNEELSAVVKSLSIFDGIGVDAIILQDLGIYAIARQYFPNLRLHASTLLGAHNSYAVKKMAAMGFARIVLAREMGIAEIEAAGLVSHAELEVFVHGAMCFSYSGLCLASSFLGGKSGLRGRCVQPCRRKYSWKGKHKGSSNGYFFSMNDINGITMLKEIREAGVNSLKIEGRMRSLNYISNVVKAYRLVIDNDFSPDSLATAQEYLKCAMGRKTSTGFFSLNNQKLISSHQSGNIGLFMGRVTHLTGKKALLTLQDDIKVGDRLRIQFEESGNRKSFTVRSLWLDKQELSSATKHTKIKIEVPDTAKPNDPIYKVDTAESRLLALQPSQVKAQNFNKFIFKQKNRQRIRQIADEVQSVSPLQKVLPGRKRESSQRYTKKRFSRKKDDRQKNAGKFFKPALPLWLKVDSFKQLRKLPRNHFFNRIFVLLTHETFAQFKRSGVFGIPKKMISWALPPIIHEENISFYRDALSFLSRKGFCDWQLGHFSQVEFFAGQESQGDRQTSFENRTKKSKKIHRPRFQRQTYHGGYTLNVLNSYALEQLRRHGLKTAQIAIEADRQIVASIAHSGKIDKGLTVYGFPALLTARASLDVFKTSAALISPKGEPFVLNELEGVTQVIAQQPFSLLEYLYEIKELGVDYGVVDLANAGQTRDPFGDIQGRIAGKHKHRRLNTFNFNGSLL